MSANVIDGKKISKEVREQIKREVEELDIQPGLAVVLVGEDPASQVYVRNKHKSCGEVGIYSEVHRLPAETTQEELLSLIDELNKDMKIHGILVQLPVPDHVDEKAVIGAVALEKDVDGFHPANVGNLVIGDVHYESAKEKAGWITPVPGGVGPMTITMLLLNTLEAAKRSAK